MYKKLGFFHFVQRSGNAINALEAELRKKGTGEIDGSLIVLPEYFNVDADYCPLPGFPLRLQEICKRFRVSFVVGLIAEQIGSDRYNSAYLIDQHCITLICHKHNNDGHGSTFLSDGRRLYVAREIDYDRKNPTRHNGTYVGALICMDSWDSECCLALTAQLTRCSADIDDTIICVPARATGDVTDRVSTLTKVWAGYCLIFANSDPANGSFIGRNGMVTGVPDPNKNSIELIPA